MKGLGHGVGVVVGDFVMSGGEFVLEFVVLGDKLDDGMRELRDAGF